MFENPKKRWKTTEKSDFSKIQKTGGKPPFSGTFFWHKSMFFWWISTTNLFFLENWWKSTISAGFCSSFRIKRFLVDFHQNLLFFLKCGGNPPFQSVFRKIQKNGGKPPKNRIYQKNHKNGGNPPKNRIFQKSKFMVVFHHYFRLHEYPFFWWVSTKKHGGYPPRPSKSC